jgi:hypothetical protein
MVVEECFLQLSMAPDRKPDFAVDMSRRLDEEYGWLRLEEVDSSLGHYSDWVDNGAVKEGEMVVLVGKRWVVG